MNDYTPFEPNEPQAPRVALDVRAEKRQVASVALAVSFIFLCSVAVQLILAAAVKCLSPELAQKDWYVIVMSSVPMYVIAMPLSLLFYKFSKAEPPQACKKLGFLTFLGLVAISFAMTYIGNIIGTVVNAVISAITGEPVINDLQELTVNTPFWANLLFCGILAPIMEEIFFRKLVIDRLRRYGELPAILMSGILFGLIHGNFSQFFYAAAMGMLFGYVYLRTGRLRYTVALHMTINLIGGVFSTEIVKRLDMEALASGSAEAILQNALPLMMFLLYLAFIGACFIGAVIALFFLVKKVYFAKSEATIGKGALARILLANPAVWILAAVILLLFLG